MKGDDCPEMRCHPILLALVLTLCLVFAVRPAAPGIREDLEKARQDVIRLTESYTEQLSTLLTLEQAMRIRAESAATARRRLFDQGLISRVELQESEVQLQQADRRVEQVKQQIADAERTVQEVKLALEEDANADDPNVIRFAGKSPWSLRSVGSIEKFYAAQFGAELPVSAFGQSPLHDRFGLAHQNAVDVAIHPDSPEGQALIRFLRGSGTSFIAFRSAVAGSATGAHIHIGPPSQRIRTVAAVTVPGFPLSKSE